MKKHFDITATGEYRGVIYKRTLKPTGESYVGETTCERIRKYSWNNKSNRTYGGEKINAARERYGVSSDVWDYDVLEEIFLSTPEELEKELEKREKEWIRRLNAVDEGFNGSYGKGMEGKKHKPESIAKISKNHRHDQSEEAIKKIGKSLKGHVVTDETKAKISAGNKGKRRTPEQRAAQSARMKGKNPEAATEAAKRWRERNGGSYWKGKKMPQEAIDKMKAIQQARGKSCVAIFPDGHEEVFNTYLDAAKATGHKHVNSVASAVKTGGTTKKGFKFKKI